MDPPFVEQQSSAKRARGRPRKRKRPAEDEIVPDAEPVAKRQVKETKSVAFVGRYVLKDFKNDGFFMGKVVYYDSGLYRVEYEDGDFEDLDSRELRFIVMQDDDFDDKMIGRRKKLDKSIVKKNKEAEKKKIEMVMKKEDIVQGVEVSRSDGVSDGGQVEDDEDSSSENEGEIKVEPEQDAPVFPPLQLPPSSSTIAVAEGDVMHLLSVYGFLRSYSILLFLYPFGLDEFVGSLNCQVTNTLLDSIHVALLLSLRRHLEILSLEGSELSSKCLRCTDWSLLDTHTWPVYLIQYFAVKGYIKGPEWKGFCDNIRAAEYYTLPASRKLMIMQILCDDILEYVEIRAEIDKRQESEFGVDPDAVILENGPKRVHPRYAKTSACKERDAMEIISGNQGVKSEALVISDGGADFAVGEDGNSDECRLCGMDGVLLCCDGCPSAYHSRCIGVVKMHIPDGPWFCPECTIQKMGPLITKGTSLRGAEIFGADVYGQVFLGTCSHLLVLKASMDTEPCVRYYNSKDIPKVLYTLSSSVQHMPLYSSICKAIQQYWDIPESCLCPKQDASLTPGKENLKAEEVTEAKMDLTPFTSSITSQVQPAVLSLQRLGTDRSTVDGNLPDLYKGSSFKPSAYMNNYLQGDFAASAAVVLASLSSEELPEAQKPNNVRKGVAANISLQVKAFSLAASRFFWPSSQRKLVEVPRERCSWCCTCKSTVSSKRGCMLNYSASLAVKGALKIMDGLSVRSGEGNIASIAKYIIYLEEVLHGLVAGSFLSASYRKEWQKRVEDSTTCNKLKGPLLELEENISNISLSGEWFKFVDDWFSESSMTQSASSGTTQKRAPSGKRQKKQSGANDATGDGHDDKGFCWWRGGNLSVHVFQKAILPRSMVRKAARQDGKKKICGIGYSDDFEIPKRSKQLVWRAAVERSSNASQLALQVRYLDLYVKWGDLVFPDQNTLDSKGPEAEASAFRNAKICNKKIVDNKTRYGVDFGFQKHLPSRVMKNVIEVEQSQGRNDIYWFNETRIPLYLIKVYEQSVNKGIILPFFKKPSVELSDLQKKQLKASRRDIFCYLVSKRDKIEKCSCASCHQDVLLGTAVKCSACQGYCHKDCTIKSAYTMTCKQCYRTRFNARGDFSTESPNSPLLMNGRENHTAAPVTKLTPIINYNNQPSAPVTKLTPIRNYKNQPLAPIKPQERILEINHSPSNSKLTTNSQKVRSSKKTQERVSKINHAVVGNTSRPAAKSRKKNTSWGVIWKKKNLDTIVGDFSRANIHLKGDSDKCSLVCCLCEQPYDSDLMYIRCDTCAKWYHADALEMNETKLPDMAGFKCCKCRRIRGPLCPYMEAELRRKKQQMWAEKDEKYNVLMESDYGECYSTPPNSSSMDEMFMSENSNPLLMPVEQQVNNSFVNVDPNPVSGTSLKKLPVRRQGGKCEADGSSGSNHFYDELSTFVEPNVVNEKESIPCAQWDIPTDGYDASFGEFNFEDMEFEPQTYFSFTELFDGVQLGGNKTGDDMSGNWENIDPDELVTFKELANIEIPVAPTTIAEAPCNTCLHTEPAPNLCCKNCGLIIHDYCSQWDESSTPMDGGWMCGQCREWR
ncbi:hypothetical protein ACFE04_016555 [Oxalis oulophora]